MARRVNRAFQAMVRETVRAEVARTAEKNGQADARVAAMRNVTEQATVARDTRGAQRALLALSGAVVTVEDADFGTVRTVPSREEMLPNGAPIADRRRRPARLSDRTGVTTDTRGADTLQRVRAVVHAPAPVVSTGPAAPVPDARQRGTAAGAAARVMCVDVPHGAPAPANGTLVRSGRVAPDAPYRTHTVPAPAPMDTYAVPMREEARMFDDAPHYARLAPAAPIMGAQDGTASVADLAPEILCCLCGGAIGDDDKMDSYEGRRAHWDCSRY